MTRPYLSFRTSRGSYAVPAERVRQIVWLPVLSEATEDDPTRVGIAHIRGAEVSVVDLDLVLGQHPEPYTLDHRLLDLSIEGARLGIVVTEVLGVVQLGDADIDEEAMAEDTILPASAAVGGELFELVDVDALATLSDPGEVPAVSAESLFGAFSDQELEELARRQRELTSMAREARGGQRTAVIAQIGDEEIALPLEGIRRFINLEETTPVPSTPDYIIGLMNHKGEVVTIVDVRGPLGLEEGPATELRVVALVDLPEGVTGLALTTVGETITVGTPEPSSLGGGDPILARVSHKGRSVPLVDPIEVLQSETLAVEQEA